MGESRRRGGGGGREGGGEEEEAHLHHRPEVVHCVRHRALRGGLDVTQEKYRGGFAITLSPSKGEYAKV